MLQTTGEIVMLKLLKKKVMVKKLTRIVNATLSNSYILALRSLAYRRRDGIATILQMTSSNPFS